MIDPFDPDNLKPAAYELTVGEEYSLAGKRCTLSDEPGKNGVDIPPYEVIIVRTRELVNLPRFIIARWNIRVKWAYEGLLWVGGPQVDPGWVGHLSCPIYNLSNKPVRIRLGEPIAVMDFVKTTPFAPNKSKPYERPPKRVTFDAYEPERLKSALYTEARERIDMVDERMKGIEDRIERFGTKLDTSLGIIFAAVAVLIAVLSIFVTSSRPLEFSLPIWFYLSLVFSLAAVVISIFSLTKARRAGRNGKSG
jgi:deoxycytidine triphosphate deaminase/tetrahydromethanopterin S-methyltransferase subunit G